MRWMYVSLKLSFKINKKNFDSIYNRTLVSIILASQNCFIIIVPSILFSIKMSYFFQVIFETFSFIYFTISTNFT